MSPERNVNIRHVSERSLEFCEKGSHGGGKQLGGSYFDSNQSTDQPRFFIVESISSPQM